MAGDWHDISTAPNGDPETGADAPLVRLRLEDGIETRGYRRLTLWVNEQGLEIRPAPTHWSHIAS